MAPNYPAGVTHSDFDTAEPRACPDCDAVVEEPTDHDRDCDLHGRVGLEGTAELARRER